MKNSMINKMLDAIFGAGFSTGGFVETTSNDSPPIAKATPPRSLAVSPQRLPGVADFYSKAITTQPFTDQERAAAKRWFYRTPMSTLLKRRAQFGGHIALVINNNPNTGAPRDSDPYHAA